MPDVQVMRNLFYNNTFGVRLHSSNKAVKVGLISTDTLLSPRRILRMCTASRILQCNKRLRSTGASNSGLEYSVGVRVRRPQLSANGVAWRDDLSE